MQPSWRGLALSLLGVLWICPDTVCIRLASTQQSGTGCVVFYKHVAMSLAVLLGLVGVYRGPAAFAWSFAAGGFWILLSGLFLGLFSIALTIAMQIAPAANVLLLFHCAPLWSAFLGFITLGERLALRTRIALICAVGSVVVVLAGSFEGVSVRNIPIGEILGLVAGFGAAAYYVTNRVATRALTDLDMNPANAVGAVLGALLGLVVAEGRVGLAEGQNCALEGEWYGLGWIVLDGGVLMPVTFAALTLSSHYVSATEAAMVQLLEVFLGPLLVWIALGEVPSFWTFVGGAFLVTTLVVHGWASYRAEMLEHVIMRSLKGKSVPLDDSQEEDPFTQVDMIDLNASPPKMESSRSSQRHNDLEPHCGMTSEICRIPSSSFSDGSDVVGEEGYPGFPLQSMLLRGQHVACLPAFGEILDLDKDVCLPAARTISPDDDTETQHVACLPACGEILDLDVHKCLSVARTISSDDDVRGERVAHLVAFGEGLDMDRDPYLPASHTISCDNTQGDQCVARLPGLGEIVDLDRDSCLRGSHTVSPDDHRGTPSVYTPLEFSTSFRDICVLDPAACLSPSGAASSEPLDRICWV